MAKQVVKLKKQQAHKTTLKFGSFERRRTIEGWTFSIPWIVGFIWFMLIPLFLSVRTSFFITKLTDPYGFGGESTFVGFDNYIDVIKDPAVGKVVFNSFLQSLYKVPIVVAFALFCSVIKTGFSGKNSFPCYFLYPCNFGRCYYGVLV